MTLGKRTLIIVSDKFEAEQVINYYIKGNSEIIATSLAAEFYLKENLENWENPLYKLIENDSLKTTKKYLFPNFKLANIWCSGDAENNYLQYIKLRFGYFLAELDRSLAFAQKAIKKFKPNLIMAGQLKDYPGSSILNGSLETNAFYLIAKSRKISFKFINSTAWEISLRQKVGGLIKNLRFLKKQKLNSTTCDLLMIASPKHLMQITGLIDQIKRYGISIKIITYN